MVSAADRGICTRHLRGFVALCCIQFPVFVVEHPNRLSKSVLFHAVLLSVAQCCCIHFIPPLAMSKFIPWSIIQMRVVRVVVSPCSLDMMCPDVAP